jgi:hypothetical protein
VADDVHWNAALQTDGFQSLRVLNRVTSRLAQSRLKDE